MHHLECLRWPRNGKISSKRPKEVMLGKPIIKGTRLTVEHILRELGTGVSHEELFDNYPNLKPEHIQAALQYAADVLAMAECIYQ